MKNLLEAIVPIIVFFTVVSGIISSIRETMAAKAKKQGVPEGVQQSRAESEIAAFLAASTTPAPPVPRDQSPSPRQMNQPGSMAQAESQPPKQKQRQKAQRPPATDPQGRQTAARKKAERSAGSGPQQPAESIAGQQGRSRPGRDVDGQSNEDLDEDINRQTGSQSGQPTESSSALANDNAAADLLKALRSPVGVRQAILVSEILSKPRALRR